MPASFAAYSSRICTDTRAGTQRYTKSFDAKVPREIAGKIRVTIVIGSKKSIGPSGMSAVQAVVATICGTQHTRVIMKEHGERKLKYDIKVYFDCAHVAAQIQPALTVEAILAALPAQVPYSPCVCEVKFFLRSHSHTNSHHPLLHCLPLYIAISHSLAHTHRTGAAGQRVAVIFRRAVRCE